MLALSALRLLAACADRAPLRQARPVEELKAGAGAAERQRAQPWRPPPPPARPRSRRPGHPVQRPQPAPSPCRPSRAST
ncbi:MAG: hypothetical protein MZW92_57950 [Comamonadaceae bacterium]|nr:hypothetical protein [Comamonadaceae bacterium]